MVAGPWPAGFGPVWFPEFRSIPYLRLFFDGSQMVIRLDILIQKLTIFIIPTQVS